MIKSSLNTIAALLAALPLAAIAQEEKILNVIVLTAPRIDPLGATKPSAASQDLQQLRAATSDSARLLQNIPGVSLYGAGAISSLPAIHGLADDRIRVQVDGMDLMAACPNHMNSALSYIDPSKVGSITVYAGITPVSVGGDSIGGTIQVKSAPPEFAEAGQPAFAKGQAGTFFRSNANAKGYNIGATWVGHDVNLSYSGSRSQADNYKAARDFKAVTRGRENGPLIPGNVVGSSAYSGSKNQELALALRHEEHLLQLSVSRQTVGFEGFPNQRMDMTGNQNTLLNLRYTGRYQWGELEARLYDQDTRHNMDMGPDRYAYGYGMPMDSKGKTRGATIQGSILSSGRDIVRLGAEYQQYTLYDWWPAVGGTMGPNAYWNVDYGQRNKIDVYSEWEASWNTQWLSQIGVRSTTVRTNAAPVQGYDNGLAGLWGNEAAAFNALDRKRTEHNWDLSAIARYTPDATQHYEAGYARKSRSPSLYQRYPWSTQPMAALMNNFVGDGNGYVGNVDLRPEVAHSVSVTGNWQGADAQQWGLTATGYATYVQDYIDARRCDFNQCSAANVAATTGFVLLQYANQSARLYGIDLSAHLRLGKTAAFGSVTGTGLLNYVRGENRTTGDDLYNIMPLNVKLALVQSLGAWSNTAEFQWVAAKKNVSQVRNEMRTGAYGLLNLRSSYEWQHARLDIGIENALDRFYAMPLGGAYVGQGASMTSNGIPWGVPIPGIGRSMNIALNLHF
ncbi:TonB-dependent receptor plug domain-containing protein [Janthinobacterium sp. 78]|uniref:TonB-dependent receptor n=1 Tax=Janthinobacterium sp. 78 TaxID=2135631 RepID=UPI000D5F9679|nr:TonB-dependent receptor plug domain-containing protein [Janthinobacterium sp. 78]PVX37171.1 iron complex outermembrane receptor protein [Janthinobacterium sp. 78]